MIKCIPLVHYFEDFRQDFVLRLSVFASRRFKPEDLFQCVMDGFTEGLLFGVSSAEVQVEEAMDIFCRNPDRFSACQDLNSVLAEFDSDMRFHSHPQVAWLCAFFNSPDIFSEYWAKFMPQVAPHSGEAPHEFVRCVPFSSLHFPFVSLDFFLFRAQIGSVLGHHSRTIF